MNRVPGLIINEFSTASDFLDALGRRNSRWGDRPLCWIFRGQADARWNLLPSAFRPETRFRYSYREEFCPVQDHYGQLLLEADLVRSFLIGVDRQGLPIPGEVGFRWIDFLDMLVDLEGFNDGGEWPPANLAPLFALAQHHGIPTRLLDWTERPLIAAYFAAVGAAKALSNVEGAPERLAVWALNFFEVPSELPGGRGGGAAPVLRFVRAPRASNPNLRAQEGVFTLLVDKCRKGYESSHFPPLDELVCGAVEPGCDSDPQMAVPVLRKLELPTSEAGKLLRLLADEWVSATHLYPGIDGVVQGLREHALWDV